MSTLALDAAAPATASPRQAFVEQFLHRLDTDLYGARMLQVVEINALFVPASRCQPFDCAAGDMPPLGNFPPEVAWATERLTYFGHKWDIAPCTSPEGVHGFGLFVLVPPMERNNFTMSLIAVLDPKLRAARDSTSRKFCLLNVPAHACRLPQRFGRDQIPAERAFPICAQWVMDYLRERRIKFDIVRGSNDFGRDDSFSIVVCAD
jgi:hypothetical protein